MGFFSLDALRALIPSNWLQENKPQFTKLRGDFAKLPNVIITSIGEFLADKASGVKDLTSFYSHQPDAFREKFLAQNDTYVSLLLQKTWKKEKGELSPRWEKALQKTGVTTKNIKLDALTITLPRVRQIASLFSNLETLVFNTCEFRISSAWPKDSLVNYFSFRALKPLESLTKLQTLVVNGQFSLTTPEFDGAEWKPQEWEISKLRQIQTLKSLTIPFIPKRSAHWLERIQSLTALEHLTIQSFISKKEFDVFINAFKQLKTLRLDHVYRLTDDSFKKICKLQALETLELHSGWSLHEESFSELIKLTKLRKLSLFLLSITEANITQLKELKKLTYFHLSVFSHCSSETYKAIFTLENLTELILNCCSLQLPDMQNSQLSKLKSLTFSGLQNLDEQTIATIKRLEKLEKLAFQSTLINDNNAFELVQMPQLQKLKLFNCVSLTDNLLTRLEQLNNLQVEELEFTQSMLTEEAINKFKQKYPLIKLTYKKFSW
jgi:hypothetical protein